MVAAQPGLFAGYKTQSAAAAAAAGNAAPKEEEEAQEGGGGGEGEGKVLEPSSTVAGEFGRLRLGWVPWPKELELQTDRIIKGIPTPSLYVSMTTVHPLNDVVGVCGRIDAEADQEGVRPHHRDVQDLLPAHLAQKTEEV